MNKVFPSAEAALKGIVSDAQLLAVGGFGLCGIPRGLDCGAARQRRQGPDRHFQ